MYLRYNLLTPYNWREEMNQLLVLNTPTHIIFFEKWRIAMPDIEK